MDQNSANAQAGDHGRDQNQDRITSASVAVALAPPSEPPPAGTEVETLLGALERQRRYVAWKCGGLDAEALRATLPPSAMTLGGMLKHLAVVEDDLFSMKLDGRPTHPAFAAVDWEADRDWEWRTAAGDSPEQLTALWRDTIERSRAAVAEALADGGLDRLAGFRRPDGGAPSLRRLLMDGIEEYARHLGHIDLIRESIDGLVGEDPQDGD